MDRHYYNTLKLKTLIDVDGYSPLADTLKDKKLQIEHQIAVFPGSTGEIVINYPGHNGSLAGAENHYLKLAESLQQKHGWSVILSGNTHYRGYKYDQTLIVVLKEIIEYALENSKEICGKPRPLIYLMGFSAGACAIAAVASDYPEVKKILLIAPSGDIEESVIKRKFPEYFGRVFILIGEQDFRVGPNAGLYYYNLAIDAFEKKLINVPNCDHSFSGNRNKTIRAKAPSWAFGSDTCLTDLQKSFRWKLAGILSFIRQKLHIIQKRENYSIEKKSREDHRKEQLKKKQVYHHEFNIEALYGYDLISKTGRYRSNLKRIRHLFNPLKKFMSQELLENPIVAESFELIKNEIIKNPSLLSRQLIDLFYSQPLELYNIDVYWFIIGEITRIAQSMQFKAYNLVITLINSVGLSHISNYSFWKETISNEFTMLLTQLYKLPANHIAPSLDLTDSYLSVLTKNRLLDRDFFRNTINNIYFESLKEILANYPSHSTEIINILIALLYATDNYLVDQEFFFISIIAMIRNTNKDLNLIKSTLKEFQQLLENLKPNLKKDPEVMEAIACIPIYARESADKAFHSLGLLLDQCYTLAVKEKKFMRTILAIPYIAGIGTREVFDILKDIISIIPSQDLQKLDEIINVRLFSVLSKIHEGIKTGFYKAFTSFQILIKTVGQGKLVSTNFWDKIIDTYFLNAVLALMKNNSIDNRGGFIVLEGMIARQNTESLENPEFWDKVIGQYLAEFLENLKKAVPGDSTKPYMIINRNLSLLDEQIKNSPAFFKMLLYLLEISDEEYFELMDDITPLLSFLHTLFTDPDFKLFQKACKIALYFLLTKNENESLGNIGISSMEELKLLWPVIRTILVKIVGLYASGKINKFITLYWDDFFSLKIKAVDILRMFKFNLDAKLTTRLMEKFATEITMVEDPDEIKELSIIIEHFPTDNLESIFYHLITHSNYIDPSQHLLYASIIHYLHKHSTRQRLDDLLYNFITLNRFDDTKYPQIKQVIEIKLLHKYIENTYSILSLQMYRDIMSCYKRERVYCLNAVIGHEMGTKIHNKIMEIMSRLNAKDGGLPYFIPHEINGISMGVWRTLTMEAFESYIKEGHKRSKSTFDETYLAVKREKCYAYHFSYGFMVWIPNSVYNRAIIESKVLIGKRSTPEDEVVLDKDLQKEEIRIFFIHKDFFIEADKAVTENMCYLISDGRSFVYTNPIEGITNTYNPVLDYHAVIKIIKKHKNLDSPRLIVVFEGSNSFDGLRHLFSQKPFKELFLDNDMREMNRASVRGYLQIYLDKEKHNLCRDYLECRSNVPIDKFRKKSIGSQEGYFVHINGKKYYAKIYKNPDQARAEFLSWLIYREIGIPVKDDTRIIKLNGRIAVASRWIPFSRPLKQPINNIDYLALNFVSGVFIQDRDQGMNHNYIVSSRTIMPVDFGGSFIFKSTGGLKGGKEDDMNSLPFGFQNFKDMLKLEGRHGSKNLYKPLKNHPLTIKKAMFILCKKLRPDIIRQLVDAVGFQTKGLSENIASTLIASMRYMLNQINLHSMDHFDLSEIPEETIQIRKVCLAQSSLKKKWDEILIRLPPGLKLILKAPSGRTSRVTKTKCSIQQHTMEVFTSLERVQSQKMIFLDDPDMLLMMAALFHDTGKFIFEATDKGFITRVIQTISNDLAELGSQKKETLELSGKTSLKLQAETLSIKIAGLYLPLMGFAPRESLTICEIIEKDIIGKTAHSNKDTGIYKDKKLEDLDLILKPSPDLQVLYPEMKVRELQVNIIELAKRLFIADTCLSKSITSQALMMVNDRYDIDPSKMKLWGRYENYLMEAYIKEKTEC